MFREAFESRKPLFLLERDAWMIASIVERQFTIGSWQGNEVRFGQADSWLGVS